MQDRFYPQQKIFARTLVLFLSVLTALGICGRVQQTSIALAQLLPNNFKSFEAPQVHPLALTPDGTRLLAVNTPNNSLSVFHLTGSSLTLLAEIPVGLEPVSVTARNDREAWVVNWLSDSVRVVNLSTGNITRTFEVGDEPTDVVFAGTEREMAFVCVSGLNQVKVFDPNASQSAPQVIEIRGKQPRSLARDLAGASVFVSVSESGNQTTIINANQVAAGGGLPLPSPAMLTSLPAAPNTGLILKWNGSEWTDENNDSRFNRFVPFSLADNDLLMIDARGATPSLSLQALRGIGTHIGNAVIDSASNKIYVVNMEARNHVRFEPNLRGHFISNRLSIINLSGGTSNISAIDLNPHINFSVPDGTDAERSASLALPADIARASDGTLYIAAMGSGRVGVLDSSGTVQARINVGQGPTGLALNEARSLLYVLNRFDETLSIVDLKTRTVTRTIAIGFNPEPQRVREGRRFLYDANLSAHGDVSCASCHLNGHRDGLAWDLGDPQGAMQRVDVGSGGLPFIIGIRPSNFHPMKGPMTTQSLRGITGTEPLHWRGDRAALSSFNPAFMSLLGGTRQLTPQEMAAFADFIRTLVYPPNPLQNLDRTLPNPPSGPSAARGAQIFNSSPTDAGILTCNQCHTAGAPGFGTNRLIIPAPALQEPQDFKVPQLRGLYQKIGMHNGPGEQIAGFGFLHDGSFDNLVNFLRSPVFRFRNDDERRDVEQFVLAFDTGLAPAVGLQLTINADNKTSPAVSERLNLLMSQADVGNCDLVVKGIYKGVPRGFLYVGNGMFQTDRQNEDLVFWQTLIDAASNSAELTFTGVTPGAGRRTGIDRDLNGTLDANEAQLNAIDSAQFFVWQHYRDFLNREADDDGLQYWSQKIIQCGTDAACINRERINVSAAFFVEAEFQETGYFVYRFYQASYGRHPSFNEFMPDRSRVVGGANLDAGKQLFADDWVNRGSFKQAYPETLTPTEFVSRLFDTAQLTNLTTERQRLINEMSTQGKTRSQVLREMIEIQEFKTREYNSAFVLMQYFGYLRRDADHGGYDFWLNILNNKVPGNHKAMVCAFLTSAEYQLRFSSNVTHTDRECSAQ